MDRIYIACRQWVGLNGGRFLWLQHWHTLVWPEVWWGGAKSQNSESNNKYSQISAQWPAALTYRVGQQSDLDRKRIAVFIYFFQKILQDEAYPLYFFSQTKQNNLKVGPCNFEQRPPNFLYSFTPRDLLYSPIFIWISVLNLSFSQK